MNFLTRLIVVPIVALAALLVVGAKPAIAQTSLDTAEAAAFLGRWEITLTSPDGNVPFVLDLTDAGGKLAARIGMGGEEGLEITNVTRVEDSLVARYTMPYQGMQLPVVLTMMMHGESLHSSWDFAEGGFTATAMGTKQ